MKQRSKAKPRRSRRAVEPIIPVECPTKTTPGLAHLRLALNPTPASRPRVTRWGTYYTAPYQRWMDIALASIPQAEAPILPGGGGLKLTALFAVQRPRTSKLQRPVGDIDNYLKGIMDVLTKRGYWKDDADVTVVTATKQFVDDGGYCAVLIEALP